MRNEIVTLTDVVEVTPNSSTDASCVYVFSINGYNKKNDTPEGPQQAIWNNYAAMFNIYTVRRIECKYYPYLPFTVAANNEVQTALFEPTYSVLVDSDNQAPVNKDEFLAHAFKRPDVCHVIPGNKIHTRNWKNPMKLLLQIENKEYFDTNGSWASRETIPSAPSLDYRLVTPYLGLGAGQVFGQIIVTYEYAFASMHVPGEEVLKSIPRPLKEPSSEYETQTEKSRLCQPQQHIEEQILALNKQLATMNSAR